MFKKEVIYYDYQIVYDAVYKAIETELELRKHNTKRCGCINLWIRDINTNCINPDHIEKLIHEFDGMGWDKVDIGIVDDRTKNLHVLLA